MNRLGINLTLIVVFSDTAKCWKWSVYKDDAILIRQNYSLTSKMAYKAGNESINQLNMAFNKLIDIHE